MRRTERFSSTQKLNKHERGEDTTGYKPHDPSARQKFYSSIKDFDSFRTIDIPLKRKKIFNSSCIKFQHFEIGINRENLSFEDLDKSLLPACLASFACGCETSITPCQRVMKNITNTMIKQMKMRYLELKDITPETYGDYGQKYKMFVSTLPKSYPEALTPSLQSIMKLQNVTDLSSFRALACILVHTKIDYIAYYLYKQLTHQFSHQHIIFGESLRSCINTYSSSLKKLVSRNKLSLDAICEEFSGNYGTTIIPTKMYGLFIQLFNSKGKSYLVKVLFVLILFLYPKIIHKAYESTSLLQILEKERKGIPWERVLWAAADSTLQ